MMHIRRLLWEFGLMLTTIPGLNRAGVWLIDKTEDKEPWMFEDVR